MERFRRHGADLDEARKIIAEAVAAYRKAGGRVDLRLYEGEAEGFMNRKADGEAARQAREAYANFVRTALK